MRRLVLILPLVTGIVYAQPNLQWKKHDIGTLTGVVTNQGAQWAAETDYEWQWIYYEAPPGSGVEHMGEGGLWVGGILDDDTLVTVTTGWASPSHYETYPTDSSWDTIWVAGKGDTIDIPYWPEYVAMSEQDFVCRYCDYFWTSIVEHNPLGIQVIERSYCWGFEPVDEFIMFDYFVVSKNAETIHDVYLCYWLDANIGFRGTGWAFGQDDRSWFNNEHLTGVSFDEPRGVDGLTEYPVLAARIFPPGEPTDTTFRWWGGTDRPESMDPDRYREMSDGYIRPHQAVATGAAQIVSLGPYEMNYGDTLLFTVALFTAKDTLESFRRNLGLIEEYYPDWNFPSPPPSPPLSVEPRNHGVKLTWKWEAGDPGTNPEDFEDESRLDGILRPFAGYRVYRSTLGPNGPWTLLGEYDVEGDSFGFDMGIEYEYLDDGILNNIAYYYAVTSFALPDTVSGFLNLESSKAVNAVGVFPGPPPAEDIGKVRVVPNPYRGDVDYTAYNPPWETHPPGRPWMEQDRRIQFVNLPRKCTINIFTLAGDLVYTIEHDDPTRGFEDWNLVSRVGQAIGSDIYLFTVEDHDTGNIQRGKFVVIK